MATIKKIGAENFFSLRDVDMNLGKLNVLVGPNGSGKTNILKIFKFIGDIARLDLVPAINELGGFDDMMYGGKGKKGNSISISFSGEISEFASAGALDEYKLTFWSNVPYSSTSQPFEGRRIFQRVETIVLKRTAGPGRRIILRGGRVNIVSNNMSRRVVKGTDRTGLELQNASSGLATLRRLGEQYEASGVDRIARIFEQLRLFEIDVDKIRRPVRSRSREQLRPNASNLAAYLLFLSEEQPQIIDEISRDMRFVLPSCNCSASWLQAV